MHLAFLLPAGLDRSLVHRQYPTLQQMLALGIDNRPKQVDAPSGPGRQAAAADLNTALHQTLVLPIQRQVITELVDQHPGRKLTSTTLLSSTLAGAGVVRIV